jgi:hypothetical protein
VAGRAPDRETVERTVRENRSLIERFGLAVVVFVLFWLALGLGIALLGAALVVGFELILRALAGPSGDEATETPLERSAGEGPSVVVPGPDEVTSTFAAPAAAAPVAVVEPTEAVAEPAPPPKTSTRKTTTTKPKQPAKPRRPKPPTT